MSDSLSLVYVYGIAPATIRGLEAPPGLDEKPVSVIHDGDVAALVTRLDGKLYSRERVESQVGEVSWLGPRAIAHDAVVTWASTQGGVIPLPAFTMFADENGVRTMLRERGEHFARTLARVAQGHEYGVRVFRIDDVLIRHLAELSPRVAEIEREALDAFPGQRYLLERKAEGERKAELRRAAGEVARSSYEALAQRAMGAVQDALPRQEPEGAVGVAVLNAYFLVGRA
ncbi:MAG: GvpL/GvpF family gas vesicle protein, partial [Gemmatimonadaceae bacterium]